MSYSVSDLNLIIKTILESTDELGDIEVTGEISNLTKFQNYRNLWILMALSTSIN